MVNRYKALAEFGIGTSSGDYRMITGKPHGGEFLTPGIEIDESNFNAEE